MSGIFLIVGLGNPGRQYEGSRHNQGFRVIEALSRTLQAGQPFQKYRTLCAKARVSSEEIVLAQPLTFMNLSGPAVADLLRNCRTGPDRLLLVSDDLDLPPGVIRLRWNGGSAGHRGVQSVVDALGTPEFFRLRLGIGKPPPGTEATGYVLEKPPPAERELLDHSVERAVRAVLLLIREGPAAAMSRYNRALPD